MSEYTITAEEAAGHDPRLVRWLREHDLDPNVIFQIDMSDGAMVVHHYAVDRTGKKYIDGDQIAIAEPLTVTCLTPCPITAEDVVL